MRSSLKWAAVAVGAAAIVAAAFVGGRAWAGGIPAAGALTYSGLLQDATGAALTGTQYVEVKFWNDTAASAAANLLCDTGTPTGIGLVNGRFSIALPDACTTKVGSNAGIWAEVIVGATANAAGSLGRAKIGAVPFAVEANHAVSADSASAGLATQLATIQAEVHPASAFRAYLTAATSIPNQVQTRVIFDHVDFDLATEYDNTTGIFTPKQAGYYLVQCGFEFVGNNVVGDWNAAILRNGAEVTGTDLEASNGNGISPFVSAVAKLSASDSVTCSVEQISGAAQPLFSTSTTNKRNSFSAARLY